MDNLILNFRRLLKLKGISNIEFLVKTFRILKESNEAYKDIDPYEKAQKEKGNFSNALKGERPLNREYLVPMEIILGVSLAELSGAKAEKVPFVNKGIRYIAYLNDYKKCCEFLTLSSDDPESSSQPWSNYDEYDNNFFDYIFQFKAVECLKALHDKAGAVIDYYNNKDLNILSKCRDDAAKIIELACLKDSSEVFKDYFDIYRSFIYSLSANNQWLGSLEAPVNMALILKSPNILNSILDEKDFKLGDLNPHMTNNDQMVVSLSNPYIYYLLNYALKHCDRFLEQAKAIIKFGIKYNKRISKVFESNPDFANCRINEEGVVILGAATYGNIVTYKLETQTNFDHELEELLDELNSTINNMKFAEKPETGGLSSKGVRIENGKLLKAHSGNQMEYEFLKKVEPFKLSFIPKLLAVNNKYDTFTYFKGSEMNYDFYQGMPLENIKQVIEAIKKKDEVSKKILGNGKVYVHGDLSPRNVIFDKNNLVGFIDWDTTHIGEDYEDFIYAIWQWLNIGNITRNSNQLYDRFKQVVAFYKPSKELKKNFADKILKVMNNVLEGTSKDNPNYQRIFEWVGWSKIWVELFREKITKEIG